MASSLLVSFAPPKFRVYATTAAKGAGGSTKEERGFLDWVLGNLAKEDQFYETDPVLNKVEDKNTSTNGGRKNSVSIPQKKKNGGIGGFGGLFAKK